MTWTPNALPDGWAVVPLQEVAEVAFSGVDKKTVDGEVPVSLCNYTDVFYNRRIHGRLDFMSATATPAEVERWSLRKGDVLFTKDSETPDEIGVPAYVEEDLPGVLCGYHLGRARPLPGRVDGAFLAASLHTSRARQHFARIANGVTRFGLTLGATRGFPVPLPPMSEQRRIATMLDSVDEIVRDTADLIETARCLRDTARNGIMDRRARCGPAPTPAHRSAGGVSGRTARSFGDCADHIRDLVDPPQGSGIPYVGLEHISSGTLRLVGHGVSGDVSSAKRRFRTGDILFGRLRPYLHKVARAPFDGICSTDIMVIRARDGVDQDFLYWCVASSDFLNHATSGSEGTKMPRTSWRHLSTHRIWLPSLAEQRAITAFLDSLDLATSSCEDLLVSTTSLRDALYQQLLDAGNDDDRPVGVHGRDSTETNPRPAMPCRFDETC